MQQPASSPCASSGGASATTAPAVAEASAEAPPEASGVSSMSENAQASGSATASDMESIELEEELREGETLEERKERSVCMSENSSLLTGFHKFRCLVAL